MTFREAPSVRWPSESCNALIMEDKASISVDWIDDRSALVGVSKSWALSV